MNNLHPGDQSPSQEQLQQYTDRLLDIDGLNRNDFSENVQNVLSSTPSDQNISTYKQNMETPEQSHLLDLPPLTDEILNLNQSHIIAPIAPDQSYLLNLPQLPVENNTNIDQFPNNLNTSEVYLPLDVHSTLADDSFISLVSEHDGNLYTSYTTEADIYHENENSHYDSYTNQTEEKNDLWQSDDVNYDASASWDNNTNQDISSGYDSFSE